MWDLPGRRAGLDLQWLFIWEWGRAEVNVKVFLRPAAGQLTCKLTIEVTLPQLSHFPALAEIRESLICPSGSM